MQNLMHERYALMVLNMWLQFLMLMLLQQMQQQRRHQQPSLLEGTPSRHALRHSAS
jgi:hypothetical protein